MRSKPITKTTPLQIGFSFNFYRHRSKYKKKSKESWLQINLQLKQTNPKDIWLKKVCECCCKFFLVLWFKMYMLHDWTYTYIFLIYDVKDKKKRIMLYYTNPNWISGISSIYVRKFVFLFLLWNKSKKCRISHASGRLLFLTVYWLA